MASTTIKATYSLDPETTQALEEMARRWQVSKSEALRRAIRAAARHAPDEDHDRLRALDRAQKSLRLTPEGARRWEKRIRAERSATSRSREGGGR